MADRRAMLAPRSDAGRATAENGVVLLDGPDGVAVTMTADAAARTADSLLEAARQAREQMAARGASAAEPGDSLD